MESSEQLVIDASMRESERLMLARVAVGMNIETFLATDTGRFIVGRMQQEVTDFVQWALSDEASAETFEKARAKALAARTAVEWMLDQVTDGRAAVHELDSR